MVVNLQTNLANCRCGRITIHRSFLVEPMIFHISVNPPEGNFRQFAGDQSQMAGPWRKCEASVRFFGALGVAVMSWLWLFPNETWGFKWDSNIKHGEEWGWNMKHRFFFMDLHGLHGLYMDLCEKWWSHHVEVTNERMGSSPRGSTCSHWNCPQESENGPEWAQFCWPLTKLGRFSWPI